MMVVARHRSGLTSRLLHTWAVPWRFLPFDSSKVLLEHGALYFDARSLYGRAYGPKGIRWLWPSVRDASGYRAMWSDFLEATESGRPPELTLEQTVRRLRLSRRRLPLEGERPAGDPETAA